VKTKTQKVFSRIRLSCSILIFAAMFLMADPQAEAGCQGLKGTFLQLTDAQLVRPTAEWQQLFEELRKIGINTLFLQWTVLDRKPLFQTARHDTTASAPLSSILDLAARSGIRVWFGLALDSSYWEQIKQPAEMLKPYFRRRVQDLVGFLDDLNATTAGAPFAGWYIPDEIDDRTWLDPVKRAVLKKYLAETVALLKARRPGSKVAISGFSNSFADPDLLGSFWADVIRASGIDLLLFQDGVGEGKVALENVGLYYAALDRAVRGVGAQLGAVVELFSLMPDGRRLPAGVGRIRGQIAAANRLTSFPVVAFSVPDYMSHLAGRQAGDLLSDFLSQKACRG
jgi:Domain of unknown function (DUF4434)